MSYSRSATLLRLVSFLRPFLGWVALSVLLGALTAGAGIGLLGTSAYLIAMAALHPSVAALEVAIVGVRFFGISRAVLRYLERLVSHSVNFRHLAQLRVWFYRQIEPLAPAGLQEYQSADLLSRAIGDIETLENFYVRAVAPPLSALVVIAGCGWFLGGYDPRLAWLLVGALGLGGGALPLGLYWLNRAPGAAVIDKRAELHATLLDGLQGMPDLLAYGQEQAQLEKIQRANHSLTQAQGKVLRNAALANMAGLILNGLALWGALLVAIPLVGQRIDGVILAVIALVTLSSFEAVTPLIPAAQHLESSLAAARRLFALAEKRPQVSFPAEPLPPPPSVDLRIRGLTFAYPGSGTAALEGIDLDLPAGKRVALVGASGAGKTTLANLLLRFWEFDQGEILFGGADIREYNPEDVRSRLAVVAQPAYLFSSSLRQNLRIARPGATEAEIEQVLHGAQLEDLAARLPQGLDTWVGERGLQLSGGECQRVLIARALLRQAPLWILDEPTANLDVDTEKQVLETLRQASQGRSVITITHRLVGMEEQDEILVLKHGRVVERGRHSHLLAQRGIYARMWRMSQEAFG
jgi:ATP-binding cassette, subfamily C, bacterial CydC